jgi:hypothetical protein
VVKTYPFLVLNGVFQAVYVSFNKNGVHILSTSDKLSLILYLMNPRFFLHEHLKEPVIFVDSRPNIAQFSMINNINLIVQTIIRYFIALVFFRHRKCDSLKSIFLLILFGTSSSMSIPAKLRSLGIHANAGLFSMLSTMLRI